MSDLFGDHHFVFGSDHPYVPIEATAGGLQALALDPAVLDAITTRNAHTLLHPHTPA